MGASGDLHKGSFGEGLTAKAWLWQVQERMGGEVVEAASRAALLRGFSLRRAGK